jgi:5-amino-6-(5-phospho-D-ribitylamino)uracil phosphatase
LQNREESPEIKLIALDMDGTLLNEKGEVSDGNRKAVKEAIEAGIKVVLSTGRTRLTCRDHADSLELDSYLVTINGGEIWGPDGSLVERNPVSAELISWMWDLSKEHKAGFWAVNSEKVYRDEMPEDLLSNEWLKFGFNIEDDAARETVLQTLAERGELEITNSALTNIEVNALGVNKANGIKRVCELLGLTTDQVMAVGDSLNDISMIRECGWGVAMGNAQETVKEAADAVTAANTEDGVAAAIRKFALKKQLS